MTTRKSGSPSPKRIETAKKPTEEWKTGDEPATGAQRSYIQTLATEAQEPVQAEGLTKAEASKKIDTLQKKTGRGTTRGVSRPPRTGGEQSGRPPGQDVS